MLAVKSMDVRENFKTLCDKVFCGETLIVSRPKNENVVILSEKEYNELQKVKNNTEYLAMLNKSMAEAEAGNFIVKSIDELEAYEK
jgi:antitoxin YefM